MEARDGSGDRHGGDEGGGDTIEVDAHVGLVLHAITTQEQSYAVVLCAVRALRGVLSDATLAPSQKRMYMRTSVKSGALAAVWKELAIYYDREDFVLAALELVATILDASINQEVVFPSTRDTLATAAQISRHAITHGLLDCAVRLLLALERLVPLLAASPSEYEPLISVVTKIMVAPFHHVEVVMSCFRCLSEVVLTAATSFKLSDAAINVVLKVLTTHIDTMDNDQQEFTTIALAALVVVLRLAKEGQAAYLQQGLTVRLVLTVLFAASQARDLNEAEARAIECFLGDPLHFVVKKFCDEAKQESPGTTRPQVSIVLTQNLAFALLWSSHAATFIELGGVRVLMAVLEESLSTRNKHALSNAACALHHLCVTRPRESSNAIEEIQGLNRLVRSLTACKEIASDQLTNHLLAVISTLTGHDNATGVVVESGGLEVLSAILKDRATFPMSCLRTIKLLSELRRDESRRSPAAGVLVDSLSEYRAYISINSSVQHDFIRAMLFSCAPFGEGNTGATAPGLVKDLVRMMRSRMEDASFLIDICQLFLRVMTDPAIRLEMVDNGIVQLVAKAMYIHERQSTELRQLLSTILTRTAHSVDVTRNASILQTLVLMWKQSLTPPSDMDTFIESLELNCYVNVALARLKSLSGAVSSGNVKQNLCQILRNNVEDHLELKPQAFARITVCCVYALQPLLVDEPDENCETEGAGAQVHNEVVGSSPSSNLESSPLLDTLALVIESVGKIVDRVGDVQHQALTICCRFVDHVLSTHRSAVDVAIKVGWLQTASKILMTSTWNVDVQVSVMNTTAAILVECRSRGSGDTKVTEGMWNVFVSSANRLAAQGPLRANSSCLMLTLRNLELIAWSPEFRSHVLVLQCLEALYKVTQSFVFESASHISNCIISSVSSILQGVCTEVFLDALMKQAQDQCASWDQNDWNSRSQDEHRRVCAALTIVLLIDERDGILRKLSLRRPMNQITTQTLERSFPRTSSNCLRDAIATGAHLLSGPDRERLLRASIASLHDVASSTDATSRCLLWLHGIAQWTESEISHTLQVLVEGITAAAESSQHTTLEALCSVLPHVCASTSTERRASPLLSSRDRAALGAVTSAVLRQWIDSETTDAGGLQRVVRVLRLTTTVYEFQDGGGSNFQSIGFDLELLVSVCIRALGECLFVASCGVANAWICQSILFESLLMSSSTIFRASIATGADAARLLLRDSTIRQLIQLDSQTFGANSSAHVAWCWSFATALVQEHGALYGERVFKLMASPGWTMVKALSATKIGDEDLAVWRSLSDCVAVATESTGWGQMSIEEHVRSIADAFERASAQTRHRSVSSPALSDSVVQAGTSRLSLVVISLKLSLSTPSLPTSALASISKTCLALAEMAAELFRNSTVFSNDQFAKLAAMLLTVAQSTIRSAYADHVEAVVAGLFESVVRLLPSDKDVVGAYLQLVAAAFFQPDSVAPSQEFLNGFPAILRMVLQDPTSSSSTVSNEIGRVQAVTTIFDAVGKMWREDTRLGDKRFLHKLVETCIVDTAALDQLLHSIFNQQDGVDALLDMAARQSEGATVAEEVVFFMHRNSAELRHKPVRAGEQEMRLILQLIRDNSYVSSSDSMLITLSSLRTARSFRVIEAALVVLKAFARVKRCAIACCQAGGLQVLYDLLSSSVQDETTSILTLEVCCYLTSYQENLTQRAVFPLLKLLFLITDAPDHGSAFVRLAFVVLDQCVTLASPQFTYSLIQLARRHLWKWRGSCSEEEINQIVQKLYALHIDQILQRLQSIPVDSSIVLSDERDQVESDEGTVRRALSRYHSVVQLPSMAVEPSTASFIDVKTSVKTHSELSSDYGALRVTLLQVQALIEKQKFIGNQARVDEIVPFVARVVILHASVTTDVVCLAMDIMSKLSFFLRVADLVALVDVRALLGSCFLHITNSLPFTLHAACFCEHIVVEARCDIDQAVLPMTKLLYAMMDQYPEDFDITQSCMSSLTALLTTVSAAVVIPTQINPLARLNRVFRNHAHDVSVLWNCGQCLQRLVPQPTSLDKASALETVAILLDVVRANLNHSFIVQLALTCIDSIERREPSQIRQVLLEMDAIGSLVDAMGIHLDDETIVATSMHLLLRMLSISNDGATQSSETDICAAAIQSIVEKQGHLAILLVSRRQANSSSVCRLAVELLMTIVEVKEGQGSNVATNEQGEVPNDTEFQERVASELLSYDVLRFVFDIFDSFAFRPDSTSLIALLLELLYDLLSTQPGRDAIQQAADLHKLREIVDVVWLELRCVTLLEAAIDCLVNAACSTKFTNVWREFPQWLTATAASLHEDQSSPPSVEKIIGILARLAIHPSIATEMARHSSQDLLHILALVDDDVYLEGSLLSLLSQLSFDSANVPVLIMFDVIPTVIERIAAHVDRGGEELLYSCLRFMMTLASHDECIHSFHEKAFHALLQAIIANTRNSSRLQQLAHEIINRTTSFTAPVSHKAPSIRHHASVEAVRPPEAPSVADTRRTDHDDIESNNSDSAGSMYHELLWRGAVFRVRRDPKQQKKRERIMISLGESGEYLLFRNVSADVHTVERVFVTQLEVLPNAEAVAMEQKRKATLTSPRGKLSFGKSLSMPSLVRTVSRADCIFHLMIKQELVSLEASSPRERREWEVALEWLVEHQQVAL